MESLLGIPAVAWLDGAIFNASISHIECLNATKGKGMLAMVLACRWKGAPFAITFCTGQAGTESEQTVMEDTGIGAMMRLIFNLGMQACADRGFAIRNW
jgi:hypothetical protein